MLRRRSRRGHPRGGGFLFVVGPRQASPLVETAHHGTYLRGVLRGGPLAACVQSPVPLGEVRVLALEEGEEVASSTSFEEEQVGPDERRAVIRDCGDRAGHDLRMGG